MSSVPLVNPVYTAATRYLLIASDSYIATILPRVGGMIATLSFEDSQLLFNDNLELWRPPSGVNGGNPLLFPNASSLKDGFCPRLGTFIGHHGFAMTKEWTVESLSTCDAVLALESDPQTSEAYPVRFRLESHYSLGPDGLRIELTMANLDEKPMPVAPGWHPYFSCPAKWKTAMETSMGALVTKQLSNDREFDFGVIPAESSSIEFAPPGRQKLRLSFSPEFKHLQFWSQPGKDFVCIEPFLGPPNTLNTDDCILIPPGESRTLWMSIAAL
ncbi:hypothetical protein BH09SUM1_BH09SUM1_03430 [soil metagenome]